MAITYSESDRESWEYLYSGDAAAPAGTARQSPAAEEFEPHLGSDVETAADQAGHRLLRYIAEATGPVGVAELAELAHLSDYALREHLAVLKGAGLVIEEVEKRPGRGRPRRIYRLHAEAKQANSGGVGDGARIERQPTAEREAFLDAWGEAMRDGTYREDRNTPSRARYASDFQAAVCTGVLSELHNTVAAIEHGGSLSELKRISAQVATDWRTLIEDVAQRPVGKDVITKWLNVADRNRLGTGARRGSYPYGLKCYVARVAERDSTTKGVILAAAAKILRVPLPSVRRWVREVGEGGKPPTSEEAPVLEAPPVGELLSGPEPAVVPEEAARPEEPTPQQPWGDEVHMFGGVQQAFAVPSEWFSTREPEEAEEPRVALVAAEPDADDQDASVELLVPANSALEPDSETLRELCGCTHEGLLSYMAETLDAALGTIGALQEQLQRFIALGTHCPECATEQPPDGRRLSVGVSDKVVRQVHVAVLNGRYDEAVELASTIDAAQLSTESQRALAWDLAVCGSHTERS